jgi:acyl carrier protein
MPAGDRETVLQKLREVFDRVTDGRVSASSLNEQAHVFDDLSLTSLELLELRFELETVWNIELTEADAMQMHTVKDVVDLIQARTAAQ